jgi:hypothetical protein
MDDTEKMISSVLSHASFLPRARTYQYYRAVHSQTITVPGFQSSSVLHRKLYLLVETEN